jgi:hypothetical protein
MSDDLIQPVLSVRNVCQMCEGVEKLVAAKAARALEP